MANPLVQKYEQEAAEYRALEKEKTSLASKRGHLITQLNENEMVKKEMDILTEDANVYKMIGPVLIKQDRNEALSNVGKRIDFINSELKRLETSYKDLETKTDEKRNRVLELQSVIQARPAAKVS